MAIDSLPLAEVDFDAVLSLWKFMKTRRILTERREKQQKTAFLITAFFG